MDPLFTPNVAQRVRRAPLIPQVHNDKLIWTYSSNGSYRVKSAYQVIMEKIINTDHLKSDGDWQIIWKQKIPKVICSNRTG